MESVAKDVKRKDATKQKSKSSKATLEEIGSESKEKRR
jgi:hypothetical protein